MRTNWLTIPWLGDVVPEHGNPIRALEDNTAPGTEIIDISEHFPVQNCDYTVPNITVTQSLHRNATCWQLTSHTPNQLPR